MRKSVLFLLAVLLLVPTTVALAEGQEKVAVCHVDDDGNLIPISIADPALDSHLAHGDAVVGDSVDENCEPLSVAQAGCFLVGIPNINGTDYPLYVLADGSTVQPIGGERFYTDDTCTGQYDGQSTTYRIQAGPTFHLVWAIDEAEAQTLCPETSVSESLTTNLWGCS